MIQSMSKSLVMVREEKREPRSHPKNSGIVVLLFIIPNTCGLHVDAVLMFELVHLTSQFVPTKGSGMELHRMDLLVKQITAEKKRYVC